MTYEELLIPFAIALVLTPLVKRYAHAVGLFAQTNNRTIHAGRIPRIGGIAIYVAFIVSAILFLSPTRQMIGIFLGANLMFFTGLADDIFCLKPKTKLLLQAAAAALLLAFQVKVNVIRLPLGITIDFGLLSLLFTVIWVMGVTNAVNLIDGLDGLAGGMCAIILVTIGSAALIEGKMQIVYFAWSLAAAIGGFMLFNIHPASIFMGDCGSLLLGFAIAAISLVGFRSSTVMTLALPMLILFLPIIDTLSAIARRTLQHKKFSEADKSHLHHLLMQRLGHGNTVLVMWTITAAFGFCAFLYMINKIVGLAAMFVIIWGVELFIEKSAMISSRFHPLLSALQKAGRFKQLFKRSAVASLAKKTVEK